MYVSKGAVVAEFVVRLGATCIHTVKYKDFKGGVKTQMDEIYTIVKKKHDPFSIFQGPSGEGNRKLGYLSRAWIVKNGEVE